jgi:hypothetical protein
MTEERYTEPEYRVELYAQDAAHNQMLINIFRRLLRLPIKKTSQQAADKVRTFYLKRE